MNGELLIGYARWEGLPEWIQILSSNSWPANTEITTIWQVKNTGNVAAPFEVRFMGKSASAVVNPGWTVTFNLYPVTPSPGTYSYTLQIIADGQVVVAYPLEVITTKKGVSKMTLFDYLPLILPKLFGFPWERTTVNLYRQRINQSTTRAQLEDIRFRSDGFETQYKAEKISREDYLKILDLYNIRVYQL